MKQKNNEKIKLRLLYLEDSPRDIEIISELLSEAEFDLSMDCTEKKKEFVSLLRNNKYDIILSDFKLPGFDAFDALDLSKEICPEVPFICVSGSIGEEIATEVIKRGAVDYILKDRMVRLPSAIKRALDEVREKKLLQHAEEALKSSESLLNSVIDQSPYPMWISDNKGMLIRINSACLDLLCIKESEVVGKYNVLKDNIVEQQGLMPLVKNVFEEGKTVNFEIKYDTSQLQHLELKQKTFVTLDTTIFPVRDESGVITNAVIQHIDITQRKLAEEKSQQLSAIVESSTDAIIGKTLDGVITSWNKGAEKIYGYTEAEVIGRPISILVPTDHENEIPKILQSIRQGESIGHYETIRRKKDGQIIPVSITVSPIKDTQGKIVSASVICRDITERKRAEEVLRETRDYLENLLSFANAPIMVWDSNFKVTRFNLAFERLSGYSMYDVMGKYPGMLFPDDSRDSLSDLLMRTSTGEHLVSVEAPIQCKSGDIRIILWNSANIYSADNQTLVATIVHGLDITERKRAEEERNKLQAELMQTQKMESLGTLAGGIAHDFNNILGIILGYSTLLGNKKEISGQISESLSAINQAVQRGAALVRQILTFARKTSIVFDTVNPSDLVHEIISMLKQTFPKIITFKEIIDNNVPYVDVDRTQIYQVLLNLCVNARDAMPKGGSITIKVEKLSKEEISKRIPTADRDSYICINVTDTGEGMDEETRIRAFDPFFTTKEKEKGTGIGLSVVYGVMQAHHGFVDVESALGQGSTFRLYLPVSNTNAPTVNVIPESVPCLVGGTETILLVEDEEFLLEMMSFLLESNGYKVFTAKDGLEAIETYKMHCHEIAIVLTDLGLPGITGEEEVRKLKEINPAVNVICASGFFESDMKSELTADGVKGFIQKPYMPDEILQMIRKLLDTKEKQIN